MKYYKVNCKKNLCKWNSKHSKMRYKISTRQRQRYSIWLIALGERQRDNYSTILLMDPQAQFKIIRRKLVTMNICLLHQIILRLYQVVSWTNSVLILRQFRLPIKINLWYHYWTFKSFKQLLPKFQNINHSKVIHSTRSRRCITKKRQSY